MFFIKAVATELADDAQPGFLLCHFFDIEGHKHEFIEKCPVVLLESFPDVFPIECVIGCVLIEEKDDSYIVNTFEPWCIESEEGKTEFEISKNLLFTKELNHGVIGKLFNKELKKFLLDSIGKDLDNRGFYIADSSKDFILYHKKNDSYIEIIQFSKGWNETYIRVCASIVFLNVRDELSNINYRWFNEFHNNNFNKINVDDCKKKYFLKGNFGDEFHYGDVYIALGSGIIGVSPDRKKKPLGFRIKKFKSTTYDDLCKLILKRINKIYTWIEKQKKS